MFLVLIWFDPVLKLCENRVGPGSSQEWFCQASKTVQRWVQWWRAGKPELFLLQNSTWNRMTNGSKSAYACEKGAINYQKRWIRYWIHPPWSGFWRCVWPFQAQATKVCQTPQLRIPTQRKMWYACNFLSSRTPQRLQRTQNVGLSIFDLHPSSEITSETFESKLFIENWARIFNQQLLVSSIT